MRLLDLLQEDKQNKVLPIIKYHEGGAIIFINYNEYQMKQAIYKFSQKKLKQLFGDDFIGVTHVYKNNQIVIVVKMDNRNKISKMLGFNGKYSK